MNDFDGACSNLSEPLEYDSDYDVRSGMSYLYHCMFLDRNVIPAQYCGPDCLGYSPGVLPKAVISVSQPVSSTQVAAEHFSSWCYKIDRMLNEIDSRCREHEQRKSKALTELKRWQQKSVELDSRKKSARASLHLAQRVQDLHSSDSADDTILRFEASNKIDHYGDELESIETEEHRRDERMQALEAQVVTSTTAKDTLITCRREVARVTRSIRARNETKEGLDPLIREQKLMQILRYVQEHVLDRIEAPGGATAVSLRPVLHYLEQLEPI